VIFAFLLIIAALFCPVFAQDADVAKRLRVAGFAVEIEGWPDSLAVPDDIVKSLSKLVGDTAKAGGRKPPVQYDTVSIKRAAYAISRFFAENGYPYNKITVSIVPPKDSAAVDRAGASPAPTSIATHVKNKNSANYDHPAVIVHFRVDPDERVINGPAVVKGVEKRPAMYLKDVRLVPGQLYNAADVDETVRRLSARPYVREVSASDPVIIEEAPLSDGGLRSAVVPFTVAERRGMEAEGALGYESGRGGEAGSLNGRLELSFMNMLRHGESFSASYAGLPDFQRLGLSASHPWVFGLPLEVGGAFSLEVEDRGYGYLSGELRSAAEIDARWKAGIALKASETVPPDTMGSMYRFYGADVFVSLIQLPWERGRTVRELYAKTGSGAALREKSYARSNMELALGTHCPVFANYAAGMAAGIAAAARAVAAAVFTDEGYLPPAELYRVGGQGSLRGYSEQEFAFRSAVYSQIEGLYYFDRAGSIFIFVDGGIGFDSAERLAISEAKGMLGYGLGVRFPSRLGTVSVAWARNIDDGWSLGRVHVGIRTVM
jgi:outer membrane protein assembly factor BamA